MVPVGVRENGLGNSRIPDGNDESLNQPWMKMMRQVGKIFVGDLV